MAMAIRSLPSLPPPTRYYTLDYEIHLAVNQHELILVLVAQSIFILIHRTRRKHFSNEYSLNELAHKFKVSFQVPSGPKKVLDRA